jgi:predicted amidohydrolase YtcJ
MTPSDNRYDCIFTHANVVTMDPARPRAEWIAVRGGRIAAVGGGARIGDVPSAGARVIDCGGRTILPGFIDAHCHVRAYAESLTALDLSPGENAYSITQIQERIRAFCSRLPSGAWVRGKGYNEFYLAERRHPNRRDLDGAAPDHPVKLTHRSGHAHVLNSLALKLAGIDAGTGDPPGGIIDRDLESGEPTGLLFGMHRFLSRTIPEVGEAEIEGGLQSAGERMLSCGITSVQDASFFNGPKQWRRFASWKERKIFAPRVTMMLGAESYPAFDAGLPDSGLPSVDLRPGSVKIMLDRVTGSLEPSRKDLGALVASIHEAGLQAAVHALEEPAVAAAVEAIERALQRHPRPDARHRIEHCSVCRPSILRRLAAAGGAVVTQPAFLFHEGDRYLETVPDEDQRHLYAVGAMIQIGLPVGAGSDAPIADPNPMVGIAAAVERRSRDGRRLPGKGIERIQAIRMYTSGAAAVNFEEDVKGSICAGKLADFIVLQEDPLAVEADLIRNIRVHMTVLDGRIAWSAPGALD